MKYKSYRHNPPHLFADRSFYFLTAGTHEKQQLWFDDDRKRILFDAIEFWCEEYRCAIEAWVIFGNHYHLLGRLPKGEDLSTVVRKIHGRSATLLNKLDRRPGRQVWWNYWDRCIRDEGDFMAYLRYLLWNPVRHGCVSQPGDYSWSSYWQTVDGYELSDMRTKNGALQKHDDSGFDDF